MTNPYSWRPSELGRAARNDTPDSGYQIAPPEMPRHAVPPAHSQRFWLIIGFVVALLAALLFSAGILIIRGLQVNVTAVTTSSPRSTPMHAGDSVGNSGAKAGGDARGNDTKGADATHEEPSATASTTGSPGPCGINGVSDNATPCPSEAATLPETSESVAGESAATATETPAPPALGCDGTDVVAPANGKLSALELRKKFEAVGQQAGAEIAVAWYDPKYGLVTAGKEGTWPAWSTSKVPLAVAVEQAGKGAEMRGNIASAITVSDNDAADRLWRSLGNSNSARAAAMTKILRQSGDTKTVVPAEPLAAGFSIFGQTQWTPLNQVRLAAVLPCMKGGAGVTDYMRQVTPSQRWGMGRLPGATFKGGWGPGRGTYTVRQFGWYQDADGNRVFLAMATQAGSMGAGTAVLDSLAKVLQ